MLADRDPEQQEQRNERRRNRNKNKERYQHLTTEASCKITDDISTTVKVCKLCIEST